MPWLSIIITKSNAKRTPRRWHTTLLASFNILRRPPRPWAPHHRYLSTRCRLSTWYQYCQPLRHTSKCHHNLQCNNLTCHNNKMGTNGRQKVNGGGKGRGASELCKDRPRCNLQKRCANQSASDPFCQQQSVSCGCPLNLDAAAYFACGFCATYYVVHQGLCRLLLL